jgi:hypothetical protein
MTILFVGSSPSDLGGNMTEYTGTLGRDPNFTPVGSIYGPVDNDDIGFGFRVNFNTPVSNTMWIHFIYNSNYEGDFDGGGDGYFMRFFSGTTEIARIDLKDNIFFAEVGSISTEIPPPYENINVTYDISVTSTGSDVTIAVYQNGALQAEITGTLAAGKCNSVSFDFFDMVRFTSAIWEYRVSEVIVTDNVPTLGWRLATLLPNAQGTYNAWEGGTANLTTFGDGQSISTDTNNQKESWTLSSYLGPVTNSGVYAVVNKTIANIGNFGPSQITPFIRHAGVDVEGTPFVPVPGGHSEILYLNPQTGLPWNTADFVALEIGVKSTA